MDEHDAVTVFHGHTFMEAEMIKGLLEGEGILCRIPGELSVEPTTAAHQVTGGRQMDVRVAPEDYSRARAVIEQALADGKRLEGFLADNPDASP